LQLQSPSSHNKTFLIAFSIGPVQSFIAKARRTRDLMFASVLLSELSKKVAKLIVENQKQDWKNVMIFPFPEEYHIQIDKELIDFENNDFSNDFPPFSVANKIIAAVKYSDSNAVKVMCAAIENNLKTRLQEYLNRCFEIVEQQLIRLKSGDLKVGNENIKNITADMLFNKELAKKQIDQFLQIYWVYTEFETDHSEGYKRAFKKLSHLIEERKRLRDFTQLEPYTDSFKRSSIDPELSSILKIDALKSIMDYRFNQYEEWFLFKLLKIQPHEELDAISFIKRTGFFRNQELTYPSTSHLAGLSAFQTTNISPEEGKRAVDGFFDSIACTVSEYYNNTSATSDEKENFKREKVKKRILSNAGFVFKHANSGGESKTDSILSRRESQNKTYDYDAGFLFKSRMRELYEFPYASIKHEEDIQQFEKNIAAHFDTLYKKLGINEPDPYFSIFHADGDKMGVFLDALTSMPDGLALHREMSLYLSLFCKKVQVIVHKNEGSLVYSGGDDVLAFLPVHTALVTAHQITKAYRECLVDGFGKELLIDVLKVMNRSCKEISGSQVYDSLYNFSTILTLSSTIVLAHHLTPLSYSLQLARKGLDRLSKSMYGRNALSVISDKRSGQTRHGGGKWDFDAQEWTTGLTETPSTFYGFVQYFSDLFCHSLVSHQIITALSDLSKEIQHIQPKNLDEHEHLKKLVVDEIKRRIQRKLVDESVVINDGKRKIIELCCSYFQKNAEGNASEVKKSLSELTNMLILAKEFSRKGLKNVSRGNAYNDAA
jgi:CRISPR-associated protein Cmr2